MPKSVDSVNHVDAPPAAALLELVHSVMHAHRSRMYRALRDGPHPIAHMEGKVLAFFTAHPGATQRDLARHSGRDKAQLARLIKNLRDLGLLTAEVDPADRRNLRLTPTAEGSAIQRALLRQGEHLARQAVDGLGAGDRARLQALLTRMLANLGQPDQPT